MERISTKLRLGLSAGQEDPCRTMLSIIRKWIAMKTKAKKRWLGLVSRNLTLARFWPHQPNRSILQGKHLWIRSLDSVASTG